MTMAGDALRVTAGAELVVALDTLVTGVHFPLTTTAADRGYKSVAVNLSDLAAMGATPLAATGSIALDPPHRHELERTTEGMRAALAPYHAELLDPVVVRGPGAITVQAFGEVQRGSALRRDGARPGDRVYVTGTLGDAGLALWEHYGEITLDGPTHARSWSRLDRPQARVAAGRQLRGLASAAIDLSDGLVSDLAHLTRASAVRARIELSRLPLSPSLRRALEPSLAWRCASTCGDDYELCFTIPPAAEQGLAARSAGFDCAITCIGVIEHGHGVECVTPEGESIDLGPGYEHFAASMGHAP